MKLDAHVHTVHSGMSTIGPVSWLMRESYNTPTRAYDLAKARGMDLVAITDHNAIRGALSLSHLPDVIVGCEVSARFPGRRVWAHLGVLDITPAQFDEIERKRHDVWLLTEYLRDARIFTVLNHAASQVNGRMTAADLTGLVPRVDALEVLNGSRLAAQNATAHALADAYGKTQIGGSDSHTARGIGYSYTVVDGARTREEFMAGLRAGRARVDGGSGHFFTMASDIMRFAGATLKEHVGRVKTRPQLVRSYGMAGAAVAMMPIVGVALVAALGHFLRERMFNDALRRDLTVVTASDQEIFAATDFA